LCNIDAGVGTVQRVERSLDVDIGIAASQALLSALFGLTRSGHINFRRTLGRLGKNRHLIGQNFGESPRHGEMLLDGILAEGNLADGQFGDERRVSRQDAQIPVLAGNLNFLRRRLYDFLFRRDDLELESVCHFKTSVGPQPSDLGKALAGQSLRSDV